MCSSDLHYQIDTRLKRPFEAAVAFMSRLHGKAFAAKKLAEQAGELGVVIDQQDVHRSNLPRARSGGALRGLANRFTGLFCGRARRAKDSSPRRRAVGSRRAAFASPGTGRKKDRRPGSSAPFRG